MSGEGKERLQKTPGGNGKNRGIFNGCSLKFLGFRGGRDPYALRAMQRAKTKVRHRLYDLNGSRPG